MTDPTFLLALAVAILGAASLVLHVVAPRTKNLIDDRLRDDIDQVIAFIGRQAAPTPPSRQPPVWCSLVPWIAIAFGAGISQMSCATVQTVASATVDCAKPELRPALEIAADVLAQAVLTGHVDWSALESRAISLGKELGGCVVLRVVGGLDRARTAALAPGPGPDPGDDLLARLSARWGVHWTGVDRR